MEEAVINWVHETNTVQAQNGPRIVLEIGKDKNKEIYRQQHIAIRSLREALVCVLVVRR